MSQDYKPVNQRTLGDINRMNQERYAPAVPIQNTSLTFDTKTIDVGIKELLDLMFHIEGRRQPGVYAKSLNVSPDQIKSLLQEGKSKGWIEERGGYFEISLEGIHQHQRNTGVRKDNTDALIPHPPLIKEMIKGAGLGHDAGFEQAKQQLESSGHVQSGTHRSGATIYKHPKEKGSVLLHPNGHISSGEFGS